MTDDEKKPPGAPQFSHLMLGRNPDAPPAKAKRPKRRRRGQLNDGQWAPGYGPKAKKKDLPIK